jgi:hypothetical protein
MMINGTARTIIGVMPPRFQAVGADVYMPISWTRPEPVVGRFEFSNDDPFYFWASGILKKGVSLETAAADIDVIAREVAKIHTDDYPKKIPREHDEAQRCDFGRLQANVAPVACGCRSGTAHFL